MLSDDAVPTVFSFSSKMKKRDISTRRNEALARKTLINNLLEETVESEDGEDEKFVGTDPIVPLIKK